MSGFFVDLIGVDHDGFLWVVVHGKPYYMERGKALLRAYPGYDTWKDVVDNEDGRVVVFDKGWNES
jgi:hypothetical protein